MSVMSTLATELELYWRQASVGCYWTRELPDRQPATIGTWQTGLFGSEHFRSGYTLTVDRREVWRGETLVGALVAAGQIAREQLADQARTWAA